MKNKVKYPIMFLLFSALIFSASPTAFCADPCIDSTLNVPAEIQTSKSFEADINLASLNYPANLGTVLLTVNFDSSAVTYKNASLISKNGSIKSFCDGNTLKIVYLNTSGLNLNADYSDIIKIKFTAPSNPCISNISIGASQAVSIDEYYLSVNDNIEYSLTFSEKAVNSSSSARGRRIENTASSANSKKSKSSKASADEVSKVKANNEMVQEEEESLNSLNIGTEEVPFFSHYILFLSGAVFACGIGTIIIIAYRAGKKNGKSESNTKTDHKSSKK